MNPQILKTLQCNICRVNFILHNNFILLYIGSVYYGARDEIKTDQNLWSAKSLESRNIEVSKWSRDKASLANYQLDRLNLLDIDASLALSFMGGLGKLKL